MIIHQVSNSSGNFNYNACVYENTFWDSHFHANYELIYIIEGTGQIFVNGRQEALLRGEAIMIPPYAAHSLRIEDSRVWVGVFSEDYISEFSKKRKHTEYSKFTLDNEAEVFLLKNLFIPKKPPKYLLISCLYLVCSQLLSGADEVGEPVDTQLMGKILSYISENISADITLRGAAELLGYEYHYFSELFHRYFSMNFKSFINIFRCNKACLLLSDKDKSITEIAAECGFGSIRNFNRVFKAHSGYTPSEYRSN